MGRIADVCSYNFDRLSDKADFFYRALSADKKRPKRNQRPRKMQLTVIPVWHGRAKFSAATGNFPVSQKTSIPLRVRAVIRRRRLRIQPWREEIGRASCRERV